jgi:acetyltransferase-like isoleucine patch superfamily enzyme
MNQSWSIVVFCFNEVGTVAQVIKDTIALFDEHRRGLYEVLVVDDGSDDGSSGKIEGLAKGRPDVVRVIRHEKNEGIGGALRSGYRASLNENVCAVPTDGQFDVHELLPHLNIDEKTFVSFYRVENKQYSTFRKILSAANRHINAMLFGVYLRDVNWVKIYKTRAIQDFPWHLQSSLIVSEICAKLLRRGYRVIEVPSHYYPRKGGKTKGASLRAIIYAGRETLKLIKVLRQSKRTDMKTINDQGARKNLRDVRVGENVVIFDFVNAYECEIGDNTRVGAFVEIQKQAVIGKNCKISSHSFICEGVTIEDNVFLGHGVMFTNLKHPDATNPNGSLQTDKDWTVVPTRVKKGASIGTNATILPGITIGQEALVGAGSVVTKDVPAGTIVAGNPARPLQ